MSAVAIGRPGVGPGGAVLHEPLPTADSRGVVPVFVYDPREASDLPQEIQIGDEVLPAPTGRPGDARTYAGPGEAQEVPPTVEPRGSLGNAAKPDRSTQKESDLSYQASFDPSVVPFKRNRALNRVGPDGNLTLEGGERVDVPVIGHRVAPGRGCRCPGRGRGREAVRDRDDGADLLYPP